jgi:excisionase family DNA binding protein
MNPRDPATPRQIMTVTEVAEYFQLHRITVYKLVRNGRIPFFKIGSDYRFRRDEIEKWMTDRQLLKEK